MIELIAQELGVPVEVGGGVRSREAAKALFKSGVQRVVIGTAAIKTPELVQELLAEHGPERVIVSLDARLSDQGGLEVATHGWHGLQVQTVAIRLGVSRQTIYNTFTNRRGLAQALVLQLTDHFLNGVDQALAGSDDVFEQWRAAVLYTLDTAATNPLLKSILTADGRDELLPLLTTDAEPVISAARGKLADAVITVRPDVSPEDARDAAETATRLAISHVVLPLPRDVASMNAANAASPSARDDGGRARTAR